MEFSKKKRGEIFVAMDYRFGCPGDVLVSLSIVAVRH